MPGLVPVIETGLLEAIASLIACFTVRSMRRILAALATRRTSARRWRMVPARSVAMIGLSRELVPPEGFEPPTLGLGNRNSIH